MSSSTSKPSKAITLAHLQAFIAGTLKHFPNGSFTLGNTAYTTSSLVGLFQSLIDAIDAVVAAQASARDAVAAMRQVRARVAPVSMDYKRFLLATFRTATQSLADFGLEPPKAPKPRTGLQNATAAAKAHATREARGTVGKKKKLTVKGDVLGVLVTPVTDPSPAAPTPETPHASPGAPTAQPAPTASSSGSK